MPPEISVVMSVHNGEKYLLKAVQSILNQSYSDFEFIIINDGSTDNTARILASFEDRRIKLIHNRENIGLTTSLNKGIALAQGEFIARQDADDISLPERLERQVEYMQAHPEIGVLGAHKKEIDSEGKFIEIVLKPRPISPGFVGWMLFFKNPIVHSSLMLRKQLLIDVRGYDIQIITAQDYDLLVRLSTVTKISNLHDVLILYRKQPESISSVQWDEQSATSYQIRQNAIYERIGIYPKVDELKALDHYCSKDIKVVLSSLQLLIQLYKNYSKTTVLTPVERRLIRHHVGNRIFNIVKANRSYAQIWQYFLWAVWLQPNCIALGIKAVGRKISVLFRYLSVITLLAVFAYSVKSQWLELES